MKLDVYNTDWEEFDNLPPKEKIVKKTKDSDKEPKSKKKNNYKKKEEE